MSGRSTAARVRAAESRLEFDVAELRRQPFAIQQAFRVGIRDRHLRPLAEWIRSGKTARRVPRHRLAMPLTECSVCTRQCVADILIEPGGVIGFALRHVLSCGANAVCLNVAAVKDAFIAWQRSPCERTRIEFETARSLLSKADDQRVARWCRSRDPMYAATTRESTAPHRPAAMLPRYAPGTQHCGHAEADGRLSVGGATGPRRARRVTYSDDTHGVEGSSSADDVADADDSDRTDAADVLATRAAAPASVAERRPSELGAGVGMGRPGPSAPSVRFDRAYRFGFFVFASGLVTRPGASAEPLRIDRRSMAAALMIVGPRGAMAWWQRSAHAAEAGHDRCMKAGLAERAGATKQGLADRAAQREREAAALDTLRHRERAVSSSLVRWKFHTPSEFAGQVTGAMAWLRAAAANSPTIAVAA